MIDMYESPVNIIYGEMQTQIEGDVFKAIQNVGIDVNEEELLKALQYDREQYSKGYKDGYANGIDELISQLEAEVESSAKFIREYDDSIAQKAYYKGLSDALKIAEQLKGEKQ
jgi:hypothetical protein